VELVDTKIELSKVVTPLQFTGSIPVLTTKKNLLMSKLNRIFVVFFETNTEVA
jgi:hypothetical protein